MPTSNCLPYSDYLLVVEMQEDLGHIKTADPDLERREDT